MKRQNFLLPITLTAIAVTMMTGCIHTTHEIRPIHITLDINLKVDKALDDFFGDIDSAPVVPAPIVADPNASKPTVTEPTTPAPAAATVDKESN